MLKTPKLLLAIAVVATLAPLSANAQRVQRATPPPTWEILGETRVGFNVDRDLISIGQADSYYRNRSYDRLRVTADRGEVRLNNLRVRYINGFEETLQVDKSVKPGASIIVDLPGRRSYIAQIEMLYNAVRNSTIPSMFDGWLQPRVRIFGLNTRVGLTSIEEGVPANWQLLGSSTVRFDGDRDIIRLKRDADWYRRRSFERLHLVVSDGHAQVEEIRIIYINGHTETIGVGRGMKQGANLTVDLLGERSYLRQIEIRYRTQPGSSQSGLVKVYGEGRAPL
jgi:hypothetical protein